MEDGITTKTTPEFHGKVWTLKTALENNYFAESSTDEAGGRCNEKTDMGCTKSNQWKDSLIGRAKTEFQGDKPDLCVCLLKQTQEQKDAIGSKYCPEMLTKETQWEEDRKINPTNFTYNWCVQSDGKKCQYQRNASLSPDGPINSRNKCEDYMRTKYPETDYTTFRYLSNEVDECKGYVKTDGPEEVNADPGTSWYTLATYKEKGGVATAIDSKNWYVSDELCPNGCQFAPADDCAFDENWRRTWRNKLPLTPSQGTAAKNPSGSPKNCSKFDNITQQKFAFETTCDYSGSAIPIEIEHAQQLNLSLTQNVNDSNKINGDEKFLRNFCFQPETDPDNFPSRGKNLPFISIPKALSINNEEKGICSNLRTNDPKAYDAKAREYCNNIYKKYKDIEGFDFSTTGCQCFIDTKINIDENLENVTAGLQTFPHCVWKSCRESGDQLVPVGGNTEHECTGIPDCSNVVLIAGKDNILVDVKFEQNIQCSREGKDNECNSNDQCGTGSCNSFGLCVGSCDDVSCDPGFSCNPGTGTCVPDSPDLNSGGSSYSNIPIIIGSIAAAVLVLLIIGLVWWYKKRKK